MFLFITVQMSYLTSLLYLNTSHVLIYHKRYLLTKAMSVLFKYISCSYLSHKEKGLVSLETNLNTSHVLIYQVFSFQLPPFHYLNTSHVLIYQFIHPAALIIVRFKYISCSYLSHKEMGLVSLETDLNTSHVLIYPLRNHGN